jgi:hypothetical protein
MHMVLLCERSFYRLVGSAARAARGARARVLARRVERRRSTAGRTAVSARSSARRRRAAAAERRVWKRMALGCEVASVTSRAENVFVL